MKFGVALPQLIHEFSPGELREFAQLAEELGYEHILTYDRVLGADPTLPDFEGHRDARHRFHESLVALGHLAAVTDSIRLMSGVIVLPQRQTALVAKQTTEVDVLSGGRFRLGVGVGWNELEYQALGTDFADRGPRIEEQIPLLRKLWTEEIVDFEGEWHNVPPSGLNPRPVQRPIPVWLGGRSDVVLERIARIGDGWITPRMSRPEVRKRANRLESHCEDLSRDISEISVLGRLNLGTDNATGVREAGEWVPAVREWIDMGATHINVETMLGEYESFSEHCQAITDFKSQVEDAGIPWDRE